MYFLTFSFNNKWTVALIFFSIILRWPGSLHTGAEHPISTISIISITCSVECPILKLHMSPLSLKETVSSPSVSQTLSAWAKKLTLLLILNWHCIDTAVTDTSVRWGCQIRKWWWCVICLISFSMNFCHCRNSTLLLDVGL